MQIPSHKEISDILRGNIQFDIAEDIAGDVILDLIVNGMPDNLKKIISQHKNKNIKMHVKKRHTSIDRMSQSEYNNLILSQVAEAPLSLEDYLIEIE